MRKMNINLFCCVVCILLFQCVNGYGQLSIKGSTCVIANREYQYILNGNWNDSASVQLCVQGGTISGNSSGTSCKIGVGQNWARVTWSQVSTGSLSLNVAGNNASLTVQMTTELQGGRVDSAVSMQSLKVDSLPATISCSAATGGSCTPAYTYTWQKSLNNVSWTDIPNSNNAKLFFIAPIVQTTYYRRKVTDTSSNSVNYSTTAVLVINAQ